MARNGPIEIFGMLATRTVELPPENEEEKERMDKMNDEIAGLGFRTFRGATDWGFQAYEDTVTGVKKENPMQKYIPHTVKPFRSGDLVKVFKTVSDGDVEWDGVIDFDRENYHHGYQRGISPTKWSIMFNDGLPARLERDGKVIYGALEPFCETGTEGVVWSLSEYGKASYDGLNCLEDGDKLTVYNYVRDGEVEWQGRVDFGPEDVSKIGWTEVMRQTNHMDTEEWLQMSYDKRPVVITPKM